MSTEGLDEILSDAPAAETPAPEALTPAPEAAGQPRDENGRFAPKETGEQPQVETPAEQVPPTPDPTPGPETGQYAALKDERRKRQEAEARIAAMEAQFAQMQSRPQPQPEPPADFFENPDAFLASKLDQFGTQLMQRFQQQQQVDRLNASEAAAKAKYADYDDAFHAFRQAVQSNPALSAQMTASNDPAEFAYRTGKRALDLERVGSFDELIAAERAKWEAEAKAAIPAPAPSFPSTTATDTSVGQRGGPAFAGPTPLGDLIG